MRVAVTGAAGFIGAHLSERLLRDGHEVVAVDNFDPYYESGIKLRNLAFLKARPSYSFHEVDIRQRAGLEAVLSGVDAVMHLAARPGVGTSFAQVGLYCDLNVTGTAVVLETVEALGIERLVFASSSSVYGSGAVTPFAEDNDLGVPLSPYAASKVAGELLCRNFSARVPVITVLRLFTVYGPRQRPDLAVHKFAKRMLADEAIPVYGAADSFRDYTYVEDTVSAFAASLQVTDPWLVLNIGSGRPISILEMIAHLEAALGCTARPEFVEPRAGDVFGTWANIDRAESVLGYRPQWSFEQGAEAFARWFVDEELDRRRSGRPRPTTNGSSPQLVAVSTPSPSEVAPQPALVGIGDPLNTSTPSFEENLRGKLFAPALRRLSRRAKPVVLALAALALAAFTGLTIDAASVEMVAYAFGAVSLAMLASRWRPVHVARAVEWDRAPTLRVDELVARELARARRHRRPLSVISLSAARSRSERPKDLVTGLSRVLTRSLRQTDVVVGTNDGKRVVLLMSESSVSESEAFVSRFLAQVKQGEEFDVGIAAFPDERVTWAGLTALARQRERPSVLIGAPTETDLVRTA